MHVVNPERGEGVAREGISYREQYSGCLKGVPENLEVPTVGSCSQTSVPAYKDFMREVEKESSFPTSTSCTVLRASEDRSFLKTTLHYLTLSPHFIRVS